MVHVVDRGPGGLDRVATSADRFGCRSAVLVADEAVVTSGYVGRVVAALNGETAIHVVPAAEPTTDSVDDAADVVRAADRPLVVAVGGGTALDTGKLAAAITGSDVGVEEYVLGARRLPTARPLVAIPSTAGTGSEVTRTCVVTDRRGRKSWVWDEELLPRVVVLDPSATATMPPHVTAATGLDAFVHAVEALTGRRAATFDVEPGRRAVQLVLAHLSRAVARGDDLDARRGMQRAAMNAGLAIDRGGTGIAHSIGHALGTLAHVPHGAAVATGLAAALAWNLEAAADAYVPVAQAAGHEPAELPHVYAELLAACGFSAVVRRIGPLAVGVDDLASAMAAEENRPMLANNCRFADDRHRRTLAERTLTIWNHWMSAA